MLAVNAMNQPGVQKSRVDRASLALAIGASSTMPQSIAAAQLLSLGGANAERRLLAPNFEQGNIGPVEPTVPRQVLLREAELPPAGTDIALISSGFPLGRICAQQSFRLVH